MFGIMDGVGTFFNLTALIPESDRSILNPLSHLGPERPLAFCFGGLAWVSFGYGLALRALRILHLRGVEVVAGYLFPSPLIRCLVFLVRVMDGLTQGDCANGTLRRRSLGVEEALMTSGEGQKYRVAYLAGVLFCVGFLFLVLHCTRKALLDSGVGNTGLASLL